MSQPNEPEKVEPEYNPARILSQVLAQADFEHLDLGAKTFALLKSMTSDIVEGGYTFSDTTQSYCQDIIDMFADSLLEMRSGVEDEDDELEDDDTNEEVDTSSEPIEPGEEDDDDDDDDDEDDSSILDPEDEDDDEDDDSLPHLPVDDEDD